MTKDEWIWVAIRIFGIYLLVLAIIAIPEAIASIYGFLLLSGLENAKELSPGAEVTKTLREVGMAKGVKSICQLLIFSAISFYLLRYGKAIHKLASSENA